MRRVLLALLAAASSIAAAQGPSDFAWRGTLETPPQASVVRAALPPDALLRLQSGQAADVRVFDGAGQPVPFAFARPVDAPLPPRESTARYLALPLHAAQPDARKMRGAVQMRVADGSERSVWVQLTPADAAPAGSTRLDAALFDTRAEKQAIHAIRVHARLPANTPVALVAETSPDLAQWTRIPLRGRIYHFDGDAAVANDVLELDAAVRLEGRYLRLDWSGHQGVTLEAVSGLLAPRTHAATGVQAALPAPRADGTQALEWQLRFATPIAALQLATDRPNTLLPVRVLGRNQVSEPWRTLAHTVVYRLQDAGGIATNTAIALPGTSLRQLRVEATHGLPIAGTPLTATVSFRPVEVAFIAGGKAPYTLAAGLAGATPAALPLAMLASASTTTIEQLPRARVLAVSADAETPPSRWLPQGLDAKTATLWAVLLAGVAVLGVVAWRLLAQLNAR